MNCLIKVIRPDFIHNDDRGSLTQLVREGYSQINVITSKAGCFRGGHYHKINKEAFYIISGMLKLTVRKDEDVEKYTFQNGDMFVIPPLISHDFDFISDTILVSMYDKGVELKNGEMDIYQV